MPLPVIVYPVNTSGFASAFGCADQGTDVIAVEPTYWPGAMWMTGLEQSDREGTFKLDEDTNLRQGWLGEMCYTNSVKNGITKAGSHNVFPDLVTQTNTHFEKLATYATRVEATKTTPAKGKITFIKEHQLAEIVRSPLKPYPVVAVRFYDCSTARRKLVTFECSQLIDNTDEGDFAVKLCSTEIGRQSRSSMGISPAGVTASSPINVPCMDARGERLPGIPPKPHQRVGMADRRVMAFGMRMLVTQDANRIPWASLDIPGYNPRAYDYDLKKSIEAAYTKIPGTISGDKMVPGGPVDERDMNNGGGLRTGLNWPGRFLDWFKRSWQEREDFKDIYAAEKLGLYKAIATDQAWLDALPSVVASTQSWGLVPNLFTFPSWAAGQTVTLGTRKFKSPYIYEVNYIVDDDGLAYTTFAPDPWTPSTVMRIGDLRTNGDYRYRVKDVPVPPVTTPATPRTGTTAATGGPTGKGSADIVDGTVTWTYVGLAVPTAPTGSTGPSGVGTAIADGTRIRWKMHRVFFPGCSPWLYIREGRKISGQASQSFKLLCTPSKDVSEPLVPYGYPHFDVHWNNEFANDDGKIHFEGSSLGLSPEQEPAVAFMQFGSIKPPRDECPNLLVTRAISGDRLGWVPVRIEFSYIKVAEAAGIIAGIATRLGLFTSDLDYETHIRPALLKRGFTLKVPLVPTPKTVAA